MELQKKLEEKRQQRLQEQQSAKITPSAKSLRRLKELNASKVRLIVVTFFTGIVLVYWNDVVVDL